MKTEREWIDIINDSDAACSMEGGGVWQDEVSYKIIRAIRDETVEEVAQCIDNVFPGLAAHIRKFKSDNEVNHDH